MAYNVWSDGLEIQFYDLNIYSTFNKFGETSFSTNNTTANITACSRGKVVWITDGVTFKFVGEIVGYEESKANGLISVRALSIPYRLATRNSGERKEWTNQTLAAIVAQHITPVTGKAKQFGYSVPTVTGITWRNEYGSAIISLAKLCQAYKMDWYYDAGSTESRTVDTVDSETAITVAGTTFATSGDGVKESFVYVVSGPAAGKGGMVSSNTSTQLTCANATWVTWGLQAGNIIQIWRIDGSAPSNNDGWRFIIEQRKGSSSPTETVDLRTDLQQGESAKMEKLRNVIYIIGKGDGGDAGQLYTKIFHATTIRSKLSADLTAGATTVSLSDASGFPATGTVIIGFEKVSYTGKSVNDLTGCTRGVDSGTGTPNWLAAYAHNSGIDVYLYQTGATVYDESNPQSGSSIQLEGVREYKKTYLNIDNQNALDFMAQSLLTQLLYDREQSEFKLNRTLTTAVLGDAITVTDFGGTNKTYRLMGVKYDWKTDTDSIEVNEVNASDPTTDSVGLADEGIVSTIADLKDESEFNSAYNQGLVTPASGIAYDSYRLGGVLAANYMQSFNGRTGVVSPIVGDYEAWFLKLSGGTMIGGISFSGVSNAINVNGGVIEGFTNNRDWDTQVLPGYALCKSDLVGASGIFGGLKTLTVNSTLDFTAGKIILPNSITVPANCVEGQIYWDSDDNTLWLGIATNTWDSVLRGAGSSGYISKYSSAGVLGTSSLKEITSDIVFAKHLKSNAKKIYLYDGDPEGAGTTRLTLGYTGNDGELIGTNGNLKIKASTNVIMDGNKLVFQVNQTGTATSITDDATGVLVLNTVGKLKVVVT